MEKIREACFFDSWATIELLENNPRILQFKEYQKIHTQLNVYEVCEYLLRRSTLESASAYVSAAWQYCAPVHAEDIILAAQLRLQYRKLRMSLVDSIGYVVSQRLGVPFVTGDTAFTGLPGVALIQ